MNALFCYTKRHHYYGKNKHGNFIISYMGKYKITYHKDIPYMNFGQ